MLSCAGENRGVAPLLARGLEPSFIKLTVTFPDQSTTTVDPTTIHVSAEDADVAIIKAEVTGVPVLPLSGRDPHDLCGERLMLLGYTVLCKLVDRLSRRPNQFVTFDQHLRDVWDGGFRSPDTIRSAVRNLRQRLSDAGMNELAAAIRGRAGRYGLILNNGD